ncbi:CpXC domain-containing protein, partial [Caldilinea sp.]|uniref:CpXC domain-containing protein n=1 Tax=Caldilinea sp. TaxID=2293560 RepID=UPI001B189A49
MNHSFSQVAELTCSRCHRTFAAEVWLIVDAAGRPDLLARIRAGTLHTFTCPGCGHEEQVDAPLLLYTPSPSQAEGRGEGPERAHGRPPLLFSPAQGTTAEQDQEHAAGLVGLLQERMGPAWRDEWLAQGLPGVPRPLLP